MVRRLGRVLGRWAASARRQRHWHPALEGHHPEAGPPLEEGSCRAAASGAMLRAWGAGVFPCKSVQPVAGPARAVRTERGTQGLGCGGIPLQTRPACGWPRQGGADRARHSGPGVRGTPCRPVQPVAGPACGWPLPGTGRPLGHCEDCVNWRQRQRRRFRETRSCPYLPAVPGSGRKAGRWRRFQRSGEPPDGRADRVRRAAAAGR